MNPSCPIWVIIPAFNEEKTIAGVLSEFSSLPYHVVVVDDGSTDRTAELALQFPITLLKHIINQGQGAALQTGICYSLSFLEAAYLVTFDADGQHCTADIARLVEICQSGSYDVVLGSRFLKGSRCVGIRSGWRILLKLAVQFTRLITGLKLTDTHNGLRVFTRPAATKLNLMQNGMAHASEILSQIAVHHLRYCEAPVTIIYTDYSRSKGQSIFTSINIIWDILEARLR